MPTKLDESNAMNKTFNTIGIIAREGADDVLHVLQHLIECLQKHKKNIVLDNKSATQFNLQDDHATVARPELPEHCDLLVVIGGDGSFLGAARTMVGGDVPVVGVNKGKLGFLTDISPDNLEMQIDAIFNGDYRIEERFLLQAFLERDGAQQFIGMGLNDVVLRAGDAVAMIEFEIEIDKQFVCKQRSDGMIISTPTGSTAYSLSGGGPILYPSVQAITLVPMHPHTLSSRPIVVNSNSNIRLEITGDCEPLVSCDGLPGMQTHRGDVVHISRKPEVLHILHPKGHDFYKACRVKLGWSSHLTS